MNEGSGCYLPGSWKAIWVQEADLVEPQCRLILCHCLLPVQPGTPGAGHTDKLGRLKELCEQYKMWLHVEGYGTGLLLYNCLH